MLAVMLYATPGIAEDKDLEWLVVTSDRYSLAVEYPAALFHDPLMTYGEGDTVWFGPNKDGATLMVTAIVAGGQKPFERVCATGCPNAADTVDSPTVGSVSGHIDDKLYYSSCVLADGRQAGSPQELHCFHIIYREASRAIYDPIVTRMAAALK